MSPHARAVEWARRITREPAVVYFDSETTGLGPEAELCDVAVVGSDGRVLLDALICPLRSIPPEATAVHGITERMVHRAPLFREFYPRLAAVLRGRVVVIYNAEYDTGIVRQVCRAEGLPDPIERWECAMLAYGDFDGTPGFRGGMKWHRLSNAAAALGIANPAAHRALADAETTRRLVLAMAGVATPETEPMAEAMQATFVGLD
jgi:DNA polymerase III subunit epsilon